MNNEIQNKVEAEDQPPILGSWRNLYIFVLVMHAVIVTLFYLFSKYYQ